MRETVTLSLPHTYAARLRELAQREHQGNLSAAFRAALDGYLSRDDRVTKSGGDATPHNPSRAHVIVRDPEGGRRA